MNIPRAIAVGARTLIGSLPGIGPLLAAISDFAFKSIGITGNDLTTRNVKSTVTEIFGLGAEFLIPLGKVWRGSEYATPKGFEDTGLKTSFSSIFDSVQLLDLEIKVIPATKMSERQGEWTMCFTPFTSPDSIEEYKVDGRNAEVPVYNAIVRKPGAVYGSASRPLTLVYSTANNGYLRMYHPEQIFIGMLQLAYQDTLRDRYATFTAAEVAPEVLITGHIRPGPYARRGHSELVTEIFDNCRLTAMSLYNKDATRKKQLILDSTFKCEDDTINCKVSGTISEVAFDMVDVSSVIQRF